MSTRTTRRRLALLGSAVILAATAVVIPNGTAGAADAPKWDVGIGSEAARKGPLCDPETGKIKHPELPRRGVREAVEGRCRQRRQHLPGRHQGLGEGRRVRRAERRAAQPAGWRSAAAEPLDRSERTHSRRDPRQPGSVERPLRDLRPADRVVVRHLLGHRRGRAARRRGQDRGARAVRGGRDDRRQRLRHRDRGAQDPRAVRRRRHPEGQPRPAAVPVDGPGRRPPHPSTWRSGSGRRSRGRRPSSRAIRRWRSRPGSSASSTRPHRARAISST